MTRRASGLAFDDLDGSPDAETVTFSLDGQDFEIDFGPISRQRFYEDLQPFMKAARRIAPAKQTSSPSMRPDLAEIRAWAFAQGLHVAERGRICASVVKQYDAAHPGTQGNDRRYSQRVVAGPGSAPSLARKQQQHAIQASCPLTCLEGLLPNRSFRALQRHLRDREFFVHPLVGDLIDLYQQSGLAGISGLGVQGRELTTAFLKTAALIPSRSRRVASRKKRD